MSANRPTKPPRQRKRHESDSFSDEPSTLSHTHQGHAPHTTKMKVSHGPRQDVADMNPSDPLKSPAKKRQKVHHHRPVAMDTTSIPIDTKDKSREEVSKAIKVKKGKVKMVSARSILATDKDLLAERASKDKTCSKAGRRPYVPELSSEEDDTEEVDVMTPINTDTSLSVSLKKSLIQLDAFDATKKDRSGAYMVSINREALPKPPARRKSRDKGKTRDKEKRELVKSRTAKLAELSSEPLPDPEPLLNPVPSTPDDSGSYRVEFDGTSTKMIFRSGGVAEGISKADGGVVGGVVKEKKAKKHHKKKKKSKKSKSKSLEASQDISGACQDTGDTHQDTIGACQDTVGAHQDTADGASQDTDKMWFTDSLKVKIKLSRQTM